MHSTARFWLERSWPGSPSRNAVAFVMLNPSTADESTDDPTIKRCVAFTKAWGFSRLVVVNTNPMRSTDPKACPYPTSRVLDDNDTYLRRAALEVSKIVCAWGNNVRPELAQRTLAVLSRATSMRFHLGLTKLHQPRHPLYLPAALRPILWE